MQTPGRQVSTSDTTTTTIYYPVGLELHIALCLLRCGEPATGDAARISIGPAGSVVALHIRMTQVAVRTNGAAPSCPMVPLPLHHHHKRLLNPARNESACTCSP